VGEQPNRRAPGLLLPELLDSWGRVARSVAPERCEALHRFAASGIRWMRDHCGSDCGIETQVWYVPGSQVEWNDLQATAELYSRWGVMHQVLDRRPPNEDGPLDLGAAALIVPSVMWIERHSLAERLAAAACGGGATLMEESPVTAITAGTDGRTRLRTPTGELSATTVIVACDACKHKRK